MADDAAVETPGAARCPGPSTKDIILADGDNAPSAIVAEAYEYLGDTDIPYSRYTSRAYFELEIEKMWPRVWQFACREEHIPDHGDTYVYDLGPYSILIARTEAKEIKAYINSCKHRGMQLRPSGSRGCLKQLRCPFHGFTWNLDGSLKEIPCQWDFPHIDEGAFALDEVRVDTWAGFVFVNMDDTAPPLEDYLEVLPDHFKAWGLENRFTTLHVEKILPANWKLAQEAFLEAYHVLATHSQAVKTAGDANAQYDVFGDNVTRFVHTLGYPSPHLKTPITQDQIVAALGLDASHKVPEGGTARQVYADYLRGALGEKFGVDLSGVSTTEMIDSIEYHCFPNFFVFPGVSLPMVYRFRPNGDDIDSCIFDLMFLQPLAEGASAPRPADPIPLSVEEPFTSLKEMDPGLAFVYDQDVVNLERQTKGVRASRKPGQTLGNYQEIRIRRIHMTLDGYLGG